MWLWMIASERGWDDSRWGTYKQIKNAGGVVRRGEKGTKVIFWKPVVRKEEGKDGKIVERLSFYSRTWTVFNYAQCDGLDALERPDGETAPKRDNSLDELSGAYIEAQGIDLNFGGNRAFYRPSADMIQMPHKDDFETEAHFFSTLYHEIAHSTGHSKRLKRPGITDSAGFRSHKYSFEELVAEFTSVFVLAQLGRLDIEDAVFDNSAAYLRGWVSRLNKNKDWAGKAAQKAQKASEFILAHVAVEQHKAA